MPARGVAAHAQRQGTSQAVSHIRRAVWTPLPSLDPPFPNPSEPMVVINMLSRGAAAVNPIGVKFNPG
eukprot:351986-Chlamydomonas_euryale.AAC.6